MSFLYSQTSYSQHQHELVVLYHGNGEERN
nr:MAG TPA: hypothetical protein [Caudoviricetes sp.]